MQAVFIADDAVLPRVGRLWGYWPKFIAIANAFPRFGGTWRAEAVLTGSIGAKGNSAPGAHQLSFGFFHASMYPTRRRLDGEFFALSLLRRCCDGFMRAAVCSFCLRFRGADGNLTFDLVEGIISR